ncbi:TetR/AcrR family transcriptional regulator [Sphingomonas solaris]|uniref:TetR/AcrR family transcriptional regulator n=1 Tax=Alterirhizorhabdus solaris TaxID=2529389 RepID=UPI001396CC89|nr:TetR/AcrR family transcriptional regulator [Sphingomonas solaris]
MLRKRIIDAALTTFRQHGYAGASIDGVARAAGVSRTTVYALYCDKPTLFAETIDAKIVISDLSRWVAFDDRDPEIVLRETLIALNRTYYRQPNFEVLRLCIAEADRFPELFEQVCTLLGTALVGLTAYLERLHAAGRLTIHDPGRAAILFNMLALGSLKPFLISGERLSPDDRGGHLDLALHLMLHGCLGPPPAPAAPTE